MDDTETAADRADEWPVKAHLRELLMLRAAEVLGAACLTAFHLGSSSEALSLMVIVLCVVVLYASTWIVYLHWSHDSMTPKPTRGDRRTGIGGPAAEVPHVRSARG